MQLATMGSTCVAVLVLVLIKQALGVPGDAVMFMPPLEVRALDMNNKMMPFLNSRFFPTNQMMSLQHHSPVQQPAMQHSTIQRPTIQHSMQQVPMQQSSIQEQIMQQPVMQESSMEEESIQQPTMQQPAVLHHTSIQSSAPIIEPVTARPHERHNMTFDELLSVINEISDRNKDTDEEESFEARSASPGYGYGAPPLPPPAYSPPSPSYPAYSSYSSYSRPYGPPRPSYGSYVPPPPPPPPAYPAPVYAPPAVHHHAAKIGKADLVSSLLKPVTSKVTSKVSGLIGLLLSLLGGSGPGLEIAGIKSLIVDGIIKPLLVAKGGIKSLISKLSIPVISLLLINVEVLITIWWLWEECPQPVLPYAPPPPPVYNAY